MLSVLFAECHKLALYAECRYGECHGASLARVVKDVLETLQSLITSLKCLQKVWRHGCLFFTKTNFLQIF